MPDSNSAVPSLPSSVIVEAPGRLALTLINLGLGGDRINGGAGVAVMKPSFKCRVQRSSALRIETQMGVFPYAEIVENYARELLEHLQSPPVSVTILRQIPSHKGFGSKTATLLSVGRAIATLYGKQISTGNLAQIAGRARTSGIGVNTFDLGGFIVDGGHPISTDMWNEPDIFAPTRFSRMSTVPPVLFHGHFSWPLFLVVPVGRTVEGATELEHFRRVCPIPMESVYRIAHIVCFRMITAVVENDYHAFCRAVNDLQETHWKASQIQVQSAELQYVMKHARQHGFDAIGISSNGPGLYGFSTETQWDKAEEWLRGLMKDQVIDSFWRTALPKRGARVRRIIEGRC